MMVLISYDVGTTEKKAEQVKKSYKGVFKSCTTCAEFSFEADLDYSTFLKLKDNLIKIIDLNKDSLRFYYLGNNWQKKNRAYW